MNPTVPEAVWAAVDAAVEGGLDPLRPGGTPRARPLHDRANLRAGTASPYTGLALDFDADGDRRDSTWMLLRAWVAAQPNQQHALAERLSRWALAGWHAGTVGADELLSAKPRYLDLPMLSVGGSHRVERASRTSPSRLP